MNNNNIIIKDQFNNETIIDKKEITNSNILIKGNNNIIKLTLNKNQTIKELLKKEGFSIYINGNNNRIEIGTFENVFYPITGAVGLNIIIGGNTKSEECNNSKLTIGNNNFFYGAYIHIKDNNSAITIGNDCLISWCTHIWCTDGHTITDLLGKPINHASKIEIGNHVWIGKDVKISKNTKISDDSVIGWGSIITKKFTKPNVIIAGNPAKIIKENINWDKKCINEYEQDFYK